MLAPIMALAVFGAYSSKEAVSTPAQDQKPAEETKPAENAENPNLQRRSRKNGSRAV